MMMMMMTMMIMTIIIKEITLQIVNQINYLNRGNNPPDGGQNNIIAQALIALAQVLENLQPAPVQGPREQNITQVSKFHGYGNEDPAEWVKKFDTACLTNN